MLTHSYYEEDPRVRREAESLVRAGRPVEVFALRREGDPPTGDLDGVRIHRLDVQRHQGAGLVRYLREYLSFGLRSVVATAAAHPRKRFALVQVHTLPDFLAFAALPFRLAGIPVVLDLHEAMPEFFRARFPRAANALVQRALLAQERASILAADAVLTVNDALAGRLIALGVPASKVTVALNSPDLGRFDPGRFERRAFAADGTLRLVYAGALTPTYEVEAAIDAMALLRHSRPDQTITLDVYGRGDAADPWRARADAAGLAEHVRFHGRIAIEDVPAALAQADLGLAPTRRSDFTDYSLSTKIFEYGAMGKPVIASRLPMVERTFDPATVATYEPGDAQSLADVIARLVDDPLEREARIARTATRVRDLSWAHESRAYLALIERLIRRAGTGGEPLPAASWRDTPESTTAHAPASWPEADPLTPLDEPTADDPATSEADPAAAYAGRP
jgi:glycosyltransferase involved in cell wall biosynthesis